MVDPKENRSKTMCRTECQKGCVDQTTVCFGEALTEGKGGLEKNKNRLSSTICGEELQKIFKDWRSLKGLVKKHQIITNFK